MNGAVYQCNSASHAEATRKNRQITLLLHPSANKVHVANGLPECISRPFKMRTPEKFTAERGLNGNAFIMKWHRAEQHIQSEARKIFEKKIVNLAIFLKQSVKKNKVATGAGAVKKLYMEVSVFRVFAIRQRFEAPFLL